MPSLVSSFPDFFAHRGNAGVREGTGFGCNCAKCDRKISAPFEYQGMLIWCLYCGMEAGYVPLVEHPLSHRWSYGVTRKECIEDAKALDGGNYEEMAEDRARREGRLVDFFG